MKKDLISIPDLDKKDIEKILEETKG